MGADSSAKNTPNAPEFICPIILAKPESSGFQWKKASLGVRSPWVDVCVAYTLGVLSAFFASCIYANFHKLAVHSFIKWLIV